MLAAGNASPDIKKTSPFLHRPRGRGMIGPNRSYLAHLLPQSRLLFGATQRRRTLRDRAQPHQIFLSEEKIMGTGFARDIDASRASLRHQRNSAAATDVDNVETTASFARQLDCPPDRFEFCFYWP